MRGFYTFMILVICSCVNDKEQGLLVSDATLFNLASNVSSFSYFRNNMDTLNASVNSSHFAYVRVRFNPKARSAMNDSLNALNGNSFPDESMIVKEVYDAKGGPLQRYAIMYKLRNASNNGAGWVWAEIGSSGEPEISVALKGSQCVSCHADGANSDLVRTFFEH